MMMKTIAALISVAVITVNLLSCQKGKLDPLRYGQGHSGMIPVGK